MSTGIGLIRIDCIKTAGSSFCIYREYSPKCENTSYICHRHQSHVTQPSTVDRAEKELPVTVSPTVYCIEKDPFTLRDKSHPVTR
jgi:hypothetical protein